MQKKRASHFEVVISFGIFISVVVFILIYLNPIKENTESTEMLLPYLKDNFFKENSVEVTIFFLNASVPCSPFSILKGVSEEIEPNKYYITLSNEIDNHLPNCSSSLINFEVGGIRKRNVLSNSTLFKTKKIYEENYSFLMKNLSVPERINFEVFSEGYELKRKSQDNIDIFARSYKLEVIYKNGTIEKKEFTFRIW